MASRNEHCLSHVVLCVLRNLTIILFLTGFGTWLIILAPALVHDSRYEIPGDTASSVYWGIILRSFACMIFLFVPGLVLWVASFGLLVGTIEHYLKMFLPEGNFLQSESVRKAAVRKQQAALRRSKRSSVNS